MPNDIIEAGSISSSSLFLPECVLQYCAFKEQPESRWIDR